MKKLPALLFAVIITFAGSAQTGSISGKVVDEMGESIPSAHVKLLHKGEHEQTAITSLEGNYEFTNVEVGEYSLEFSYTGYGKVTIEKVSVSSGAITYHDQSLQSGVRIPEFTVYPKKPVDAGVPETRHTFGPEVIEKSPSKGFKDMLSGTPTVYSQDDGEEMNITGSRTYSSGVYLDGVRINGSLELPVAAIREINVITSGIPAKYGDVTGGIIEISTVRF